MSMPSACLRSPFSPVAHPPAVSIKCTLDNSELQLGALSCHQTMNVTAVSKFLPHFSPEPQPQQVYELQEPMGGSHP